ncbi:MAG: hypothetical protein ACFFBI_05130 [Promethearchaeota archaeon]
MKIPIYVLKTIGYYIDYIEKSLECKGKGTEEDPVIIEPSEDLPKSFKIKNSNLFIIVRDCTLRALNFDSCKNVKLENCEFIQSTLVKCSNFRIINLTYTKKLKLNFSNDIIIEDCNIKRLDIYRSNSNVIRDCNISKLKHIRSDNNNFKANELPESQKKHIEKSRYSDLIDKLSLKYFIAFVVILVFVVIFLPKLTFNTYLELPFILILFGVAISLFYYLATTTEIKQKKDEK